MDATVDVTAMCSVPFLVVTGALLAGAVYYLYVPFPEQASKPWQKSLVAVGFQIQKLLVIIVINTFSANLSNIWGKLHKTMVQPIVHSVKSSA